MATDAFDQLPESIRGSAAVESGLEQLDTIDDIIDTREVTSIYKIAVDGSDFELAAKGTVPGSLLNRFAMDEHDGNLRVATTTDRFGDAFNNVFVLDEKLVEVGALVGIGLDEEVYPTPFVGDKLYMVTSRHIEPFFVTDMSGDLANIEAELKIPGYPMYLHFYDKDTIIGIGRDGGIKVAVFDVSDMKRPRLTDAIIIGSESTFTPVEAVHLEESAHRAVLVDRTKSLLVIPVISYNSSITLRTYAGLEAVEDDEDTAASVDTIDLNRAVADSEVDGLYRGGSLVFMVFDLAQSDLELVQTISFNTEFGKGTRYARALYIGDDLYTVSDTALGKSPLSEPFYTLKIPIGPS